MNYLSKYTFYIASSQKISGDNYFATFSIPFCNVLPQQFNKFKLYTYFKSTNFSESVHIPSEYYAVIHSNLTVPSVYGPTDSKTSVIAIAPAYYSNSNAGTTENRFYFATPTEQQCCIVHYPNQNTLTIEFKDLTGTRLSTLLGELDWLLTLVFEPIEE